MNDALRVCGIHLTDFIIVGDGIYSFAKEGQL
jgi:DNA repair protein RadC